MLSPLPRRITSGITVGLADQRLGALAAGDAERVGRRRRAGRPRASAGPTTWSSSAAAEPIAAEPVRSTPALRDLMSCDATSTTTFGRASKLAPMTPTGRRHSSHDEPAGQVAHRAPVRQRLGGGELAQLAGHVGEARGSEAQPVEQAVGHARGLGRRAVFLIGGEDRGGLGVEQVDHREDGAVDLLLGGGGEGGARSGGEGGGLGDGGFSGFSGAVLVHRTLRGIVDLTDCSTKPYWGALWPAGVAHRPVVGSGPLGPAGIIRSSSAGTVEVGREHRR